MTIWLTEYHQKQMPFWETWISQFTHSSTRVMKVKVILKIHIWQIHCAILSLSVYETPTLVKAARAPQ